MTNVAVYHNGQVIISRTVSENTPLPVGTIVQMVTEGICYFGKVVTSIVSIRLDGSISCQVMAVKCDDGYDPYQLT